MIATKRFELRPPTPHPGLRRSSPFGEEKVLCKHSIISPAGHAHSPHPALRRSSPVAAETLCKHSTISSAGSGVGRCRPCAREEAR